MSKMFYLTDKEVKELRGLQSLVRQETFKMNLVEANTALVPNAKEWLQTQAGIVLLIQQHMDARIFEAAKMRQMEGAVTVDLTTRVIKLV